MNEEQLKAKQEQLAAEYNNLAVEINAAQSHVNSSAKRQVEIQGAMKLIDELLKKQKEEDAPKEETQDGPAAE